MGKIIFTIALSSICLLSMAQVRVVDTSAFDSIAVLKGAVGAEHLIGIQKSTKVTAQKCGLKVFIENAEQDDIIGATVQVMDAKRQVAGGVTDFMGFAYVPLVEAGTYDIVIRHIMIGEAKFQVTIKSNTIYELRKELPIGSPLHEIPIISVPILGERAVSKKNLSRGGLKVFIENTGMHSGMLPTVDVMDGERRVVRRVAVSNDSVYIPNINPGTYTVIIRHIMNEEIKSQVTIKSNSIYELREEINFNWGDLESVVIKRNGVLGESGFQDLSQLKGGLKVFIENAEKDDIIGATVQVMDGERPVAGGITDFMGFVYLPNIEAGTYTIVIRHVRIVETKFEIVIEENQDYELRETLEMGGPIIGCRLGRPEPIFGGDPFLIWFTTEDILRNPSTIRN